MGLPAVFSLFSITCVARGWVLKKTVLKIDKNAENKISWHKKWHIVLCVCWWSGVLRCGDEIWTGCVILYIA